MSYTKTTWQDGDIITTEKLNKIENGIEQASSGGSGSGGGPVIKLKVNMTDGTLTADPLAAGLSLTDLSDATIEMYVTDGVSEVLAGINKVCNFAMGAGNVIQMTSVTPGPNGLTPLILDYNSDTGVVTIIGYYSDGGGGGDDEDNKV